MIIPPERKRENEKSVYKRPSIFTPSLTHLAAAELFPVMDVRAEFAQVSRLLPDTNEQFVFHFLPKPSSQPSML